MNNIMAMALSLSTATPNQRAGWLPASTPGRRQQLQAADDQRCPAPKPQVAPHEVGAGDKHVRVGDRGDAVDRG